jgi:hypothetical protein
MIGIHPLNHLMLHVKFSSVFDPLFLIIYLYYYFNTLQLDSYDFLPDVPQSEKNYSINQRIIACLLFKH